MIVDVKEQNIRLTLFTPDNAHEAKSYIGKSVFIGQVLSKDNLSLDYLLKNNSYEPLIKIVLTNEPYFVTGNETIDSPYIVTVDIIP